MKKRSRYPPIFFILAAVLLPLSGVSSAGLVAFTDRAGFDVATDTVLVEDFEAVTPKNTWFLSFTSNGITYTALQATNPNVVAMSAGKTSFDIGGATTSTVLSASYNEVFEIDLSARPAAAIGFDAYLNRYGPVTTGYYGSGGNLIGSFVDDRGAGLRFLGVLADEPIYRIVWTAIRGEWLNTGMDNLELGEAAAQTPVPGAALLGVVGLGFSGWRLRRRRTL